LQREPVGGVQCTLGSAGAHDSVQLIDEEDHLGNAWGGSLDTWGRQPTAEG
jgi:hypothetical protein